MKKYFLLLVLSAASIVNIQGQSAGETKVAAAAEALRKGLVDADKKILDEVTATQLSYGHSSGKVENKEQFINEVINGPVDFISIDISNQTISIVDKSAVVRHIFYTKMKRDGKDDEIKISVLQVWQKQKGKWKLLARQAVKVP